ncbi:MAG: helix-turn-helix domain-containing protein [Thermodesulfobacteriota bacterium]|nr:helix-turn-helix domain-containing protein [Thermodesulfobacteriota bacterium]
MSSGPFIRAEDLPKTSHRPRRDVTEYLLAKNERTLILQVLQKCNWNKHEMAPVLGISRTSVYSKLKKHENHHNGGSCGDEADDE